MPDWRRLAETIAVATGVAGNQRVQPFNKMGFKETVVLETDRYLRRTVDQLGLHERKKHAAEAQVEGNIASSPVAAPDKGVEAFHLAPGHVFIIAGELGLKGANQAG